MVVIGGQSSKARLIRVGFSAPDNSVSTSPTERAGLIVVDLDLLGEPVVLEHHRQDSPSR